MRAIIVFAILFVFVMLYGAHAAVTRSTVYGDGLYYYSWLHTIAVDRDMDFTNQYADLGLYGRVTPIGNTGNIYSVGPAVFWLPWFAWGYTLFGGTGYEFWYQFIVGLSGVLAALSGLVLLYATIRKTFSAYVSTTSILSLAFATNLLFYGSLDTVNSHAVSFLVACTLVALMWYRKTPSMFWAGVLLGALIVIRPQDIVYTLILLPSIRMSGHKAISAAGGLAMMIISQMAIWDALYGSPWKSPYAYLTDYSFDFARPHIVEVLFSPNNGLLLWTPIILVAVSGLLILYRRSPIIALTALGVFASQLYIVASWSTWWQGGSYSGRMFVSTLPLLAYGIAAAYQRISSVWFRLPVVTTSAFSALNAVLIMYYLLSH